MSATASPEPVMIPKPEDVQASIVQYEEKIKKMKKLLAVSEDHYGKLPESATPRKGRKKKAAAAEGAATDGEKQAA